MCVKESLLDLAREPKMNACEKLHGRYWKLSNGKPRVSIGLPVFNGEKYLKETLDSILAQTYTDFELIISDNASTDRTPQICRAYAAKDSRIRYYRNENNLRAVENHNRVFKLSSGEYFKFASHDDVLAPEFLSRCVNVLSQNKSIVLCHSKTNLINEHGRLIGKYDYKIRVDSSKPHERFGDIISMRNNTWVLIFGLIRSSALRMTQLIGRYIGSDRNLLAEISLIGRMYEIPDYLFFRREHSQAYTNKDHHSYQEKLGWWIETSAHAWILPYWRNCLEYFKSVRRIPLRWSERQLCYAQIVRWLIREGWILMGYDVGMNLLGRSILASKLNPLAKWFHDFGGIE